MSEDQMSIVEFSQDITNAEPPPPIPAREYRAEIRTAEKKNSPNTGNDYASVQFYIAPEELPADVADDPEFQDGVTLGWNLVSLEDTPKGRYSCRKFCEAIGAPTGTRVDLNDWIGLEATVEVGHREFDGYPRANVIKVKAL